MQPHIWLRAETKVNEQRTALTPRDAQQLVDAGFKVSVENTENGVFAPRSYQDAGCELVPFGSWPEAPKDAFILGLKELPPDVGPLVHRHIFFAHIYKNQKDWKKWITLFIEGGGTLLDLEYLTDDNGRRVAAFGYWAGFAGAAVAVDVWCHQKLRPEMTYPPLRHFSSQSALVSRVRENIELATQRRLHKVPSAVVIGAKGRSGSGAVDFLNKAGADVTEWDIEETKKGGPFPEILNFDVMVNCVLTQTSMPPFLTRDMLEESTSRKLSVVSDVSCDPTSPYNSLPIYRETTHFMDPAQRLLDQPILDLIAIDHLPSLLPKESSEDFSAQLLPHLLQLKTGSSVWERAREIYREKNRLLLN